MSDEIITIEAYVNRINHVLNRMLSHYNTNARPAFLHLLESIQYSLLSPLAKRLRPILVYAVGEMMDVSLSRLDASAAAIELLHTASLVHDDLPALDNDDMRRGQASCHKAFDEATAILAGNAMQTLAFEVLTDKDNPLTATQQVQSIRTLATAYGIDGVMKGQMLDLCERKPNSTRVMLDATYHLKTASLLQAALHLGVIAANGQEESVFETLMQFAKNIGLAYQIQDDILDMETNKKNKADKNIATYPSVVGVAQSKSAVKSLYERASRSLQLLPYNTELLETIAKRMVFRTY